MSIPAAAMLAPSHPQSSEIPRTASSVTRIQALQRTKALIEKSVRENERHLLKIKDQARELGGNLQIMESNLLELESIMDISYPPQSSNLVQKQKDVHLAEASLTGKRPRDEEYDPKHPSLLSSTGGKGLYNQDGSRFQKMKCDVRSVVASPKTTLNARKMKGNIKEGETSESETGYNAKLLSDEMRADSPTAKLANAGTNAKYVLPSENSREVRGGPARKESVLDPGNVADDEYSPPLAKRFIGVEELRSSVMEAEERAAAEKVQTQRGLEDILIRKSVSTPQPLDVDSIFGDEVEVMDVVTPSRSEDDNDGQDRNRDMDNKSQRADFPDLDIDLDVPDGWEDNQTSDDGV